MQRVEAQHRGTTTTRTLELPGLPTVGRPENAAQLAAHPADLIVEEVDRVDRNGEFGLLHLPGFSGVLAVQDEAARLPRDPDVRAERGRCTEIADRECCGSQMKIDESPRVRAVCSSPGPHRHHPLRTQRDRPLSASRWCTPRAATARKEGPVPPRGTGRRERLRDVPMPPRPRRLPFRGRSRRPARHQLRASHRLPRLAAVRGGEHPRGKRRTRVAAEKAVLLVEEPHTVQSRKDVHADFIPSDAAIGGVEHDSRGTPSSNFGASHRPSGVGVQEMHWRGLARVPVFWRSTACPHRSSATRLHRLPRPSLRTDR